MKEWGSSGGQGVMNAILPLFQREAASGERLGRDEEVALVARFREGDVQAADRLLRAHLRGVVAVAVRYRRYGVPLGELVAEGAFGMVQALSKFDAGRGIRFSTYANHWIRAYVLEHVIRSWSLVGGGAGVLRSRHFFRVRRERSRVLSLLGEGEAADRALAERLSLSVEQTREMVERLEGRDLSLSHPVRAGSSVTWLDSLAGADDQERSLLGFERQSRLRSCVARAVATLDPRERYIAEHRLMADPVEELSLAEISRKMGVSRERARQLETRAKQKLRACLAELRVAG
jgi:RNA polymerase sigma-32 factor